MQDDERERRERRIRIVGPYVALFACLALGYYVVLPWYRSRLIPQNERTAATALKTLSSAEADYRANDRDGNGINDFWTGDVTELYRLGLIERGVAEADLRPIRPLVPKPVPFHGYYFVVMNRDESDSPIENLQQDTDKKSGKVHHLRSFGFSAYPVEFGVTGRETFILNENNTVRWRHNQGDLMDYWPSDEELRHDWALGD
jgi:hypothetical protein